MTAAKSEAEIAAACAAAKPASSAWSTISQMAIQAATGFAHGANQRREWLAEPAGTGTSRVAP